MEKSEDVLAEISDLYVNFYTYQGVVKAIDGIDLVIRKGETLGLVGETGCGKSVTASTIMKLVLSPPGKIESGAVYFMEPAEVRDARKEYEARAQKWYSSRPLAERKKVAAAYGLRFTGFKKRVPPLTQDEVDKTVPPERVPDGVIKAYLKRFKKEAKGDTVRQDALGRKYDLLEKNIEYMQLIRGRFISMIFQEPTAALNPVFTAGDQIAEVILQHRKSEMAKRALRSFFTADEMMVLDILKKGPMDMDMLYRAMSQEGVDKKRATDAVKALQRRGHVKADPAKNTLGLEKRPPRSYRVRMLEFIAKNPNAIGTFIERVPLLRRIPFVNEHNEDLYKEAIKEAARMLEIVRIPDPSAVVSRYPYELSGGMQQRVMIAMALACNPKLLIADEPTTALDVTIQAQILKLMRDLKESYGSSILLITHNLGVVAEMCDRVGVMYAGSMAEIGSARTIFKEPLHPYTHGLMKSVPSAQQDAENLFTIRGSVPNLVKPPGGCRFHPRCDYARDICKKTKPKLVEVSPGHLVACHKVTGAEGYE
jgi:peptide/nickel transport system ATP-binding protein